MKRFKSLFAASLLALALCSPGLAAVTRYKVHVYDQNGNNVNCSTGTTIASIILQPYGSAAGAVGTSNTISTITVSSSGTPTTLTTSTTSATVIADNAGNIWFDLDPEVTGDCTIIFGTITKSGITFSGSPPQVDCLREASRILTALPNAAASASGGLLTVGTSSGQINPSSGKVPATVASNDGSDSATLLTRIGSPVGASIAADIAANATSLSTVLTRVPSALTISGGKVASTLAATDVTGNVNANLVTYTPSAGSATTLGSSFAFPNAAVSSYAGADTAGTTTLLSRLPSTVQLDGSGYVKVSNGTGTGQFSLLSGAVALQSGQTVASVSGSVGSVAGNVSGNVQGSVASVTGDLGGKILGGGTTAFSGDGVQVNKTGYSLSVAPPTAAAIRTEIDANSTQLAKLGTPAGASLAADIAATATSLSTLLTRVPNTLPTFPTNFATLAINGSGYVTATNGGGGGSSGLSNDDIAAIWAYLVPNVPTASSYGELIKNKLTPITFDGSNNINANANAISNGVKAAIVSAISADAVDGSLTRKQVEALMLALVGGKYTFSKNNTNHTATTTYYRNDGTSVLATSVTTYATDNTTITGRTTTFSNLP